MSKLDLTSGEAIDAEAERVKRMLEKEFGLPFGAADKVNNDILRLFVWRDEKEDPGPLTGVAREIYSQKYFDELFNKKRARGDLIFRNAKEGRNLLLAHDFKHLGGGKFERGNLMARIMKTNLIFKVFIQNQITGAVLENEKEL